MKTNLLLTALLCTSLFASSQSFQLVKDINPAAGYLNLNSSFREMNGKVYYVFTDELTGRNGIYVSDGTSVGTYKITPENISVDGNLIVGGNKIFFFASDDQNGKEPWVTDGTLSGTKLLKNIHPSTFYGEYETYSVTFLSADANKAFFIANDGTTGNELWVTDGTPDGTKLVKDIFAGSTGSQIQIAPPAMGTNIKDGKLYFFALDGSEGFTVHGKEPWVSDGTSAGTFMLKDIKPGFNGSSELANTKHFIEYKGKMYFFSIGNSSTSGGLYETNGTEAGTQLVYSTSFYRIDEFLVHNNLLYFTYSEGPSLYTSDGTSAGTKLLATIPDGQLNNLGTCQMIVVNNTIYFRVVNKATGSELFKLNESNQIVNVKDIWAGISNGVSGNIYPDKKILQVYDNKIWFLGSDGSSVGSMQVWSSDGTSAGTVANSPLNGDGGWAGGSGNHYNLFASSFGVFMIYTNPTTGSELYFYKTIKTGLNNIEIPGQQVSVFPNPSQNQISIESKLNFEQYQIFNITGQSALSGRYQNKPIDISSLRNGVYLLSLFDENGKRKVVKIVKE